MISDERLGDLIKDTERQQPGWDAELEAFCELQTKRAEVRRLNAAIADAVALNPHAPTCNTWYQGDCNCWHGVLGDTE